MRRTGLLALLAVISFLVAGVAAAAPQATLLVSGLLNEPGAVAVGPSGNLYVVNGGNSSVLRIAPDRSVTALATGLSVVNGTIAADAAGNAYVVDIDADTVYQIQPDGTVGLFASNLGLIFPDALAFDPSGNLYVGDQVGNIVSISPSGSVSTVLTASTELTGISALAFDSTGTLYIAGFVSVGPSTLEVGVAKLVAGGTPVTFEIGRSYTALAVDSQGNLYGSPFINPGIDVYTPSGALSATLVPGDTVTGLAFDAAGTLDFVDWTTGFAIEQKQPNGAISAYLSNSLGTPRGLAPMPDGGVYALDATGAISKIDPLGQVTPFVDGFSASTALAADRHGNLYVDDGGQTSRIAPDGTVTRGVSAASGPLAVDGQNNLYIAVAGATATQIIQVTPAGASSLYAQLPSAVPLPPIALAIDPGGAAVVLTAAAPAGNGNVPSTLWRVSPSDPGRNDSAAVDQFITALAVDAAGNIFYSDGNGLDEIPAGAKLNAPVSLLGTALVQALPTLAFDSIGNLYGGSDPFDGIVRIVLTPSPLAAAVLPGGRAVQLGTAATVFTTLLNGGDAPLDNCRITLPATAPLPLAMSYQTTDAATNTVTGSADQPVQIPAHGAQSFVLSFTAAQLLSVKALPLQYQCDGVSPAPVVADVSTVDLIFSTYPIGDVIALAATPSGDGVVSVPVGGSAAFAVATIDAGAPVNDLSIGADTGGGAAGISVLICQTDPQTAQCLTPMQTSLLVSYVPGEIQTFSIFVSASTAVPLDPASSRIFVRINGFDGSDLGSTSVAVKTM